MGLITSYNKSLRTIAVFSTFVNETLVGSTGAELEKKSVANFRYGLSSPPAPNPNPCPNPSPSPNPKSQLSPEP